MTDETLFAAALESPDRGAFLSLLKRQGIDTSALERLA